MQEKLYINLFQRLFKIIKFSQLLLFVFLVACSSPLVKVNLDSSSDINTGIDNKSYPVVVKVYQLTNIHEFNEATFRQLWKEDDLVLGKSLVDKQIISIVPDSSRELKLSRDKKAKYLAVVAVFRNPHNEDWRAVESMPGRVSSIVTSVTIDITANKVRFK